MTGYHEWLAEKRKRASSNYEERRGFYPTWPPVDTIKPGKYDGPMIRDEPKPFDRRRIVFTTLFECERIMHCYSQLLAQPPNHNREHFLDWMGYANDRYARALKMKEKLPPAPA